MSELTVLIVSHGHPERSHGAAEVWSHLLFRCLGQEPGVNAYYAARTDDPSRAGAEGEFCVLTDRLNEMLFFTEAVDPLLFSQKSQEAIARFVEVLREIRPDAIHFHHYTHIGLEMISVARQHNPRIRIIVTLHEYFGICHHHGQMIKTDMLQLCEAASSADCHRCFPDIVETTFTEREAFIKGHFAEVDLFIAPSEFLRLRYIAWGVPDWQIVTIESGIPPVDPAPPRPLGRDGRRGVFGFFGQINPFKGLPQLLMAFRELAFAAPEAIAGIELIVHGAGLDLNPPHYVALVRRLLAETAERVSFVVPYDNRDLGRLMAIVDWVVVPSICWENSPVVIQEAYAYRRPVICGNVGGMAEKVRDGLDGYHFPIGDSGALARLIARVAADPPGWDRLQQTIGRPASLAEIVARHLEIYRDTSFSFA